MVLLGIRTAVKEDLHCTATELVYGTTLHVPGEFFTITSPAIITSLTITPDPASYVAKLKGSIKQLQDSPIRVKPHWKVYINKDLPTSMHMLVHPDTVCKPLQPPCDGLYVPCPELGR